MASWSKHTWYTTFRRQRVLFCFGFPSIFIRRNRDECQGGLPGERHRSHSQASCPATLGGWERWAWGSLERARGLWGLEANLYQVLPTGAQNSNEEALIGGKEGKDLPGGVMKWSWLGLLRIHTWEFAMWPPGEVKVHPTEGLLLKFIDSSRDQTPHSFAFPLPSTVRNPNV